MPIGYIVYDERLNDTIEMAEEDGQHWRWRVLPGPPREYPAAVAGSLWFRKPNTVVSQTCMINCLAHLTTFVQKLEQQPID